MIVVACNTVHKYFVEMQAGVDVPILSIINETVKVLQRKKIQSVLVLGTPFALQHKLYENKLTEAGIESVLPTQKERGIVFEAILSVLEYGPTDISREIVLTVIDRYEEDVGGVILGCTELPLLLKGVKKSVPLFDTLQILGDAVYNYSVTT